MKNTTINKSINAQVAANQLESQINAARPMRMTSLRSGRPLGDTVHSESRSHVSSTRRKLRIHRDGGIPQCHMCLEHGGSCTCKASPTTLDRACLSCQRLKRRCNKIPPTCSRCKKSGKDCSWPPVQTGWHVLGSGDTVIEPQSSSHEVGVVMNTLILMTNR